MKESRTVRLSIQVEDDSLRPLQAVPVQKGAVSENLTGRAVCDYSASVEDDRPRKKLVD
jgi:hypothetical protein